MGLCMLGIEELANLATGQAPLAGQELLRLLPWYLGWPAVLALPAAFVSGLPGRALVAAAGVWTLVIGAVASMVLQERGLPGPLGFALVAIAALVACPLLLRLAGPRLRTSLAVLAVVFLPAFRAVNLNAYGAPLSTEALTADALILLVSLGLAIPGVVRLDKTSTALIEALSPGLLALVLSWVAAPPPATPTSPQDRPDLVLVVIDTLRADHLGLYGYDRPTSPGLDALAERCLVYEDALSPTSWTLPSFASLLTGTEPHRHGAGVNPGERNTQAPLSDALPTVPERLAAKGYRTGGIVTNPYLKASFGLGRGFQHYDDALGLAHMMMLLHPIDQLPFRAMPDRTYRLAPRMLKAARTFWKQTEGGPRFLMLHLMDPHKPYNAPAEDRAVIGTSSDAVMDVYDAEIRFADRHLAPFVEELLAEGATVLITADHGEEFGDHPGAYPGERWPPDVRHGHTLYQEQLHVPLIACAPGGTGARVTRPVRSLDVAPTLLALAGAEPIDHDGQPLSELLGTSAPTPQPRRAQSIRYGTEKRAVIDVDGFKLIESQHGEELYVLPLDPREQQDQAEAQAERRAGLRLLLPAQGEGEAAEIDAATLEALKAVGYVDE